MSKRRYYWRGRDIELMSRKELIAAYEGLANEYDLALGYVPMQTPPVDPKEAA